MEISSYGICLWLHVAMETEHGLLMVNDLVTAFILYMLSVIVPKLFITRWKEVPGEERCSA